MAKKSILTEQAIQQLEALQKTLLDQGYHFLFNAILMKQLDGELFFHPCNSFSIESINNDEVSNEEALILTALAGYHTACTTILNPKVDQEIRDTFLQIGCHCFEAGLNVKNNSEDE